MSSPAEKLSKKLRTHTRTVKSTRDTFIRWNNLPLQKLRNSLKLTQAEVADAIGVSRPHIANAESGFNVTLSTALRLAKFYGKSVEDIWK